MSLRVHGVACMVLWAAWQVAPAPARQTGDEVGGTGEPARRAAAVPTEGFWPTRLMLERILLRITDDMADRYDLDDDQLERTRAIFMERIPRFLNENRAEIQALTNQFFEVQLADEAPQVEEVATWSQRVLPLLEGLKRLGDETADEMREFLTDDQLLQLDGEMAAFHTGLAMATNKVTVWAEGGYDPETEWVPPGRQRRERERAEERRMRLAMREAEQRAREGHAGEVEAVAAANASPPAPADAVRSNALGPSAATRPAPAPVRDEWERYVDDFCRRYDFTAEQRDNAERLLQARRKQRDEILRKKAREIEAVSARLKSASSEEERKAAAAEFERLNAPIERIFQQLKDGLDKLPTRPQRARAAELDAARSDAAAGAAFPAPR